MSAPVVGIASTATGLGYWLVAGDGGIFSFGDAVFYGSTGALRLDKPVIAMTPTRSGRGYWLVAVDGGVFTFGDATFYGSTGGTRLNAPVVGLAPTSTDRGYWLVAADGGIFAFGDGLFYGSMGATRLNAPMVGIRTTGNGYWLVAADGGVFTFGDGTFYGSTGALNPAPTVVGLAGRVGGLPGYLIITKDGQRHEYGPILADDHQAPVLTLDATNLLVDRSTLGIVVLSGSAQDSETGIATTVVKVADTVAPVHFEKGGGGRWRAPLTPPEKGSFQVAVTATDRAANSTTRYATVSVQGEAPSVILLNPATALLGSEASPLPTSVDSLYTLHYPSRPPFALGSVLSAGITSATPTGLLRRAEDVYPSNGEWLVSTSGASISDAIISAHTDASVPLEAVEPSASSTVTPRSSPLSVSQTVAINLAISKGSLSATVTGSASYEQTFNLHVDVDPHWTSVDATLEASIRTHYKETTSIDVRGKGTIPNPDNTDNPKNPLFHKALKPIAIDIGVPLIFYPEVQGGVGLDGEVSGAVKYTRTTETDNTKGIRLMVHAGLDGVKSSAEGFRTVNSKAESHSGVEFSVNGSLRSYVYLRVDIGFYGLRGVTIGIEPSLRIKSKIVLGSGSLTTTVEVGVVGKVKVDGKLALPVFGSIPFKSASISLESWTQLYKEVNPLYASPPPPTALPDASLGNSYSADVSKGDTDVILLSGRLPRGLALSGAGRITGVPKLAGSFSFTVVRFGVAGVDSVSAYRLKVPALTRLTADGIANSLPVPASDSSAQAVVRLDEGMYVALSFAGYAVYDSAEVSDLAGSSCLEMNASVPDPLPSAKHPSQVLATTASSFTQILDRLAIGTELFRSLTYRTMSRTTPYRAAPPHIWRPQFLGRMLGLGSSQRQASATA